MAFFGKTYINGVHHTTTCCPSTPYTDFFFGKRASPRSNPSKSTAVWTSQEIAMDLNTQITQATECFAFRTANSQTRIFLAPSDLLCILVLRT